MKPFSHKLANFLTFASISLTVTSALISTKVQADSTKGEVSQFIQNAVDNPYRSEEFKKRDQFRHPAETLSFLEFGAGQTIVEIWPARGWYTEILAPALKGNGKFIAAHFSPESKVKFFRNSLAGFKEKLTATPDAYSEVEISALEPPKAALIAAPNTADGVYTFRNVHNWMRNETEQDVFNAMYAALKPGGILGVVEHRAKPGADREFMVKSGYVTEEYVKTLAKNAGFVFKERSEINANPVDLTDHPNGVWTLPPTLRVDSDSKLKYLAIGESDRMTLKFEKP